MLRIAIVDHLIDNRIDLKTKINNILNCDKTYFEYSSAEELLFEYDNTNKFDIIFLAANMAPMNGIDAAKEIRKENLEVIIIIMDETRNHALEAFEVFATYYLVQPVKTIQLQNLFEFLSYKLDFKQDRYLPIRVGSNLINVKIKEIIFIESIGRIANIYTKNNIFECYKKLIELEQELNNTFFVRCHQSYLVNLDYVASYSRVQFVLSTKDEIPISKSYLKDVKDIYYDYLARNIK